MSVRVLFRYSDRSFFEGYKLLFDKFPEVSFIPEEDFCEDIKELVYTSPHDYVGFFTDDCVMFRPLRITEIDEIKMTDLHCFSLRLGRNTVIQNYLTGEQQVVLKANDFMFGECICWNFKHYYRYINWGYLFSWDGCFYSKEWLDKNLSDRTFENPRAMEHQLNSNDSVRMNSKNLMAAPQKSCVFVNTINAVQNQDIPSGTKFYYSPEELNDKLLSGKVISLSSFSNVDIRSSHEEFALQWEDV